MACIRIIRLIFIILLLVGYSHSKYVHLYIIGLLILSLIMIVAIINKIISINFLLYFTFSCEVNDILLPSYRLQGF